jgi:hypothetical protein
MNVISHTAHIHQSEISNRNVAHIALQITKEVFEQRALIYYLVLPYLQRVLNISLRGPYVVVYGIYNTSCSLQSTTPYTPHYTPR